MADSSRLLIDGAAWTEDERRRIQKRTLVVVVVSQVLGGAGLAAGVAVGALLAKEMLGTEKLSGLPVALFTLGSAAAAFSIGRLTQRWGRRVGLGVGFSVGGLGAVGVVSAAVSGNVALLFGSLFVYGAGMATNLQARYAGTDLANPARRATAISVALTATTVGAVAGPNLIEPLGRIAESIGIPALAGPFLLAAVAYTAAGSVLITMLRPDPYLVARQIEAATASQSQDTAAESESGPAAGAYVGAVVMIIAQVAMAAIMTMTPVHMRGHHHGLSAVGLVISLHVAAMYLPSLITGALVDRVGPAVMAVASGATLLAAGLVAAYAPGTSLVLISTALILLGLGWNFGLISGTTFVVDATDPAQRPRVQGAVDVLVAIAGASGGAMSGVVMSAGGYAFLSISCGLLALALLPVLLWHRRRPNTVPV